MPPHVLNEFATAAFRFGHTLLRDKLFRTNLVNGVANNADSGSEETEIGLADNFFRPFVLFDRGGVSSLMHGCTAKNSDAYDQTYVKAVRDELFRDQGQRLGFDLLSFDVQRGRDHGLPPYNTYRELCGLGRLTSFEDLAKQLGNETADRFRCAYASVDDIDLYVGGIAEQPTGSTGVVGPTFGCIIAQQFHQTKKGDRFWFERPGRFTPAQLDELRKVQLSRLVCDNTDITRIQPWILWKATTAGSGSGNDEVDCSELAAMNLDEFASMLPERGPNNDQNQPQPPANQPPTNSNRPSNNRPPPPPPRPASSSGFGGFGNFLGGGSGGGGLLNLPFLNGGGGGGGGFFPGFGG